jgi:hypothetical protein
MKPYRKTVPSDLRSLSGGSGRDRMPSSDELSDLSLLREWPLPGPEPSWSPEELAATPSVTKETLRCS